MRKLLIIIIGSIFINLTYADLNTKYYAEYLLTDPSKRVSMDFEDADLIDVLKALSQQVGLNFICPENIRKRKITCYFENVTLKEAFDSLLEANNLTYEFLPQSNIFIVKELGKPEVERITKVYRLKYARVSNSKLESEIISQFKEKTSEEEGVIESKEETGEEGESKVSRYSALKKAVMALLSDVGRLIEDPRTNSLIITDVPSRFPAIEEVIRKLDVPVPQVMIEAEILDVSRSLLDKLGFKYGEQIFVVRGVERNTAFPLPSRLVKGIISRVPEKKDFTPGKLSFGTVILEYIRKHTDTKLLARPRILTLSNETAEIRIIRNEAIGKKVTAGETAVTEEAERAQTGVTLRVTPQVNLDTGEITMVIVPTVSEALPSPITLSTATGPQELKDPEERIFKSVLTVKDGDTIVLSGLIKNKVEQENTKLPFLADIPMLGALFRHKKKERKERELLVFISPKIVWSSLPHKKFAFVPQREQKSSEREKAIKEALEKFEK